MGRIGHNNPPGSEVLTITDPIEYMRYLVRFTAISTTAKAVGHELVCCMKKGGSCWPSTKELMANTGIKDSRTMTSALKDIEEKLGVIIERKNGAKSKYFAPQPPASNAPALNDTTCIKPTAFNAGGDNKPCGFNAGGSRTPMRGRSLSQKNINPTPKPPPLNSIEARDRESVCAKEVLPEGFKPLGHGVTINCETVQHKDFTISIPAVEMQLELTPGCAGEDARKWCQSFALQWASELESGKEKFAVVPGNITRAIASSVTRKVRHQEQDDQRAKNNRKSSDKDKIQAIVGGNS